MSHAAPLVPVILLATPLTPLLLALALIPRATRDVAARATPWAAIPALAAALLPHGAVATFAWLLLGAKLGLDTTAHTFLVFTAALWLLAGIYAREYLSEDAARIRFLAFYLAAMSGNLGLIVSRDVVSFFVFFALMSFASYGLVGHARDPEARYAGRVYLYLVVLGEVLLFAGLAMAAHTAGSLDVTDIRHAPLSALAVGLLIAGFGIKAGAVPLHLWLPLAHPVAPTPASAVLSGAMIEAGLLGWMRFLPLGTTTYAGWGGVCAAAGLGAAFYGVLVGVVQRNPKTVLAYSSISQMGFMTLGIGVALAAPQAAVPAIAAVTLYALHHGLAKGALFLAVGVAAGGTAPGWRRGLLALGLLLPALALAGAPLTGGALAKATLKSAVADAPVYADAVLTHLLPYAAAGTAILMARFVYLVWPRASRQAARAGLWVPWLGCVALVAAVPWLWHGGAEISAGTWSLAKIGAAAWPVALGVALALVAWRMRAGRGMPSALRVPPGDLVVLVDAMAAAAMRLWDHVPAAARRIRDILREEVRATLAGLGARLARLPEQEMRLQPWNVAGLALLGLVVAVFLLAAFG